MSPAATPRVYMVTSSTGARPARQTSFLAARTLFSGFPGGMFRGIRRFFRESLTGRLGPEQREQDDFADGMRIGEQHGDAVNANAFASGRWHPVGQRAHIIHVYPARRLLSALFDLLSKAALLLCRIVQLGKGVAEFHPRNVDLE